MYVIDGLAGAPSNRRVHHIQHEQGRVHGSSVQAC